LVKTDSNCLLLKFGSDIYTKNISMQFLLVAFDGTDPEALERRMKARPGHLENVAVLKKQGEFLLGGAILDDDEETAGWLMEYEFPGRSSLYKCV